MSVRSTKSHHANPTDRHILAYRTNKRAPAPFSYIKTLTASQPASTAFDVLGISSGSSSTESLMVPQNSQVHVFESSSSSSPPSAASAVDVPASPLSVDGGAADEQLHVGVTGVANNKSPLRNFTLPTRTEWMESTPRHEVQYTGSPVAGVTPCTGNDGKGGGEEGQLQVKSPIKRSTTTTNQQPTDKHMHHIPRRGCRGPG